MKKMLNVLLNSKLTNLLQQITGEKNTAAVNYNFQPVPSYWKMTPLDLPVYKKRKAMPFLSAVIILLFVSVTFSSCYTAGYGCKGHSRIMTRVQ